MQAPTKNQLQTHCSTFLHYSQHVFQQTLGCLYRLAVSQSRLQAPAEQYYCLPLSYIEATSPHSSSEAAGSEWWVCAEDIVSWLNACPNMARGTCWSCCLRLISAKFPFEKRDADTEAEGPSAGYGLCCSCREVHSLLWCCLRHPVCSALTRCPLASPTSLAFASLQGSFQSKTETPQEAMKRYKREVDRAVRDLDRERMKLERQQEQIAAQIRKSAKENQIVRSKQGSGTRRLGL